jgi:hypothetical protein
MHNKSYQASLRITPGIPNFVCVRYSKVFESVASIAICTEFLCCHKTNLKESQLSGLCVHFM